MDRPCDQAFAGARFAHDEYGRRRCGTQTHLLEQPPVRWTNTHQAIEPESYLQIPLDLNKFDVKLAGL